ncbi:hypothetical protein [uncultured Alistipes sp.]|uniref:hypothetical protein n=1 Tax=uncultured Alistipes sp. TaxID=538949 RepID=UPI002611F7ED|nr:hypothetical protein [uncultured Alistipes sp.]
MEQYSHKMPPISPILQNRRKSADRRKSTSIFQKQRKKTDRHTEKSPEKSENSEKIARFSEKQRFRKNNEPRKFLPLST